ncbi:ABC transporter substrate-binding protein [Cohnella fermenti]|nr:sugar ABC transporter substrate-binding protein [Cohnella fermenti]
MAAKRSKTMAVVAMSGLLGTVLYGCGGNNGENGNAAESPSGSAPASGASASQEPAKEEKVTLTVSLMSSDWIDAAQEIMDRFTEKYPNIKVDFSQVPNDTNAEYLQPKAAANSLPDFMTIDGGTFGAQLADNGLLVDLSDTAAANNTIEGLKPVFTSSTGKLFGIAGGLSTTLIFYNKQLFEKAGIAELPQNWEQFLAVCEKLKAAGITPLIVAGADGTVNNTVWSNGFATNVIGKDPDAVKKIAEGTFNFNTPEYADIYGKFKTLFDKDYLIKGVTSLQYSQANDEFLQGKAAMSFSGVWLAGTMLSSDFGTGVMMPPWNVEGQERVPVVATETGFAVAEGKHKDAALKLLDFMINDEGFYIYQNKKGNVPMTVNPDPAKVKIDPLVTSYIDDLKSYSKTGPLWFEFLPSEVQATLVQTFQRVLTGELTPEQAAEFTQTTYEQAMKK